MHRWSGSSDSELDLAFRQPLLGGDSRILTVLEPLLNLLESVSHPVTTVVISRVFNTGFQLVDAMGEFRQ